MKKLTSILMAALLVASMCMALGACSKNETTKDPVGTQAGTQNSAADTKPTDDKKVYTVGICQLLQHDALDAATKAFKDALIKEFGEDGIVFDEQNASNDSSVCPTICNSFVSKKVDLIMANATPALQAAYNATQDIPVLGTSVTEYGVALKIDDFNGTVGSNVSGTSDLAPLTEQADMLLEIFPEAKKVGLLYCSAEPNSEYQVKVVEEYLTEKGLTCKRFSFSDSNDLAAVTNAAVDESDVIYVPTDNTAAGATETIKNIVVPAGIPVVAGEEGICSGCGVVTLSISYYDLGYKTGEMAVKILKGESDIKEMPIEYAPATKKYNPTIVAEYEGITIPEGYVAIEAEG